MNIDLPVCVHQESSELARKNQNSAVKYFHWKCPRSESMENSWSSDGNSESEAQSNVNSSENNENNLKNISPYMSKDVIAAAGFNVETPIVNAIIGNLTGALPTKKSETETLKCEICDCELSSDIVLNFHINGSRHKKRLKALEIIAQLKEGKDKGVQIGDSENPNAFRCEICSLTVNSAQQLEIHLTGAKHKKKAAKAGLPETEANETNKNSELSENKGEDKTEPPAPKKKKKDDSKVIPCDICNVFMNSQTQYDQHLLSKKHLNKINGIQQPRKLPGRDKFIKFPHFRSGGTEYPMGSNCMSQNNSNQQNSQLYKRIFSQPNFIVKSPFYKTCKSGDNTNFFRQSPADNFQTKF